MKKKDLKNALGKQTSKIAVNTELPKRNAQVIGTTQSNFDYKAEKISQANTQYLLTKEVELINIKSSILSELSDIKNLLLKAKPMFRSNASFERWYNYVGLTKEEVSKLIDSTTQITAINEPQNPTPEKPKTTMTHEELPVYLL